MIMIIIVLAYVGLAVLDNVSIADLWEDVGYYHRYLRQQQLRLRQIKSPYPHNTAEMHHITSHQALVIGGIAEKTKFDKQTNTHTHTFNNNC